MPMMLQVRTGSSPRWSLVMTGPLVTSHDDVIKWKHFPRYWPFVRGIHRSPVNSPHKGQWRGALMLSLICARINDWVTTREAGDLRRRWAHYDVTVMISMAQCKRRNSSVLAMELRLFFIKPSIWSQPIQMSYAFWHYDITDNFQWLGLC